MLLVAQLNEVIAVRDIAQRCVGPVGGIQLITRIVEYPQAGEFGKIDHVRIQIGIDCAGMHGHGRFDQGSMLQIARQNSQGGIGAAQRRIEPGFQYGGIVACPCLRGADFLSVVRPDQVAKNRQGSQRKRAKSNKQQAAMLY